MAVDNQEISHRIRERFSFYFVALIFTILGLSLQTASFGKSIFSDVLELVGWASLLISGLSGLSRLNWTPNLFFLFDEQQTHKSDLNAIKSGVALGQVQSVRMEGKIGPPGPAIQKKEEHLEMVDTEVERLQKKLSRRYRLQQWGFYIGVSSLAIARAAAPALHIIKVILGR